MAYPPAYERTASFTDWETTNPGEPKPGVDLDTEFDNVANALTGTQNALALIQRADGALANNSVGPDQLQDDLFVGIADDAVADAEAAAAAAAGSASAAAGSASAAASSAAAAATSAGTASGAAAAAATAQGVAQIAATDAGEAADDAGDAADAAELAANTTTNSVAQAQLHEEMAFKWAEYLAAPVMPAPPGWPEAVDDGMFSSKWWALRSRDFNSVHHIDLGTSGANIGAAFDQWDLTNDLPVGMIYASWGTPPHTYALTDPSNPSNPASWTDMTGGPGPAGPPNTLTIGSVVSGTPAAASITGTAPNQVLSLTIPPGATGATGATGPAGATGAAGPPNTLSIGTVTTGAPGSTAGAAITGAAPNQTLSLTIPRGDVGATGATGAAGAAGATGPTGATGAAGPANSLSIGSVTTGAPGSAAGATITGTAPTQVLSLTIPRGDVGATGAQGIQGIQGIQGPVGATGPTGSAPVANPTAVIGLTAVNGASTNAIRSDGAPALSQAIVPTWTGAHTFNGAVDLAGLLKASGAEGISGQVIASQGPGQPPVWRSSSGGSIELGYNFNTSTAVANPGSQKLAFNNATFAGTTALHINITAFTNFDASTILSLLQAGNRIYIQQRNDASKACVYQVTGAATNNTGWWTVPVTLNNAIGTPFPNNADLNCVFILSGAASVGSDPTASVGLTAVNGVATTYMRSDAAPPLSQAINPTWTGNHVWSSGTPGFWLLESDQTADEQKWRMVVSSKVISFRAYDAAESVSAIFLQAARGVGTAISSVSFGNATNSPNYSFLGVGSATFGGQIRAADGTALLPGITFSGNTDTGFFRSAANRFQAVCQGVPRAQFSELNMPFAITGTAVAGNCYMGFYENQAFTTRKGYVGYGNAADDAFYINNQKNDVIVLGTNNISRVTIAADGSVVVGAATSGAMGVGTVNAQGLYINGVAVTASAVGANPTGTIGLAAVNGSAGTFLRSDGAPALSQAIAPTWSAQHIFTTSGLGNTSAIRMVATQPAISFRNPSAALNEKEWELSGRGTIFQIALLDDTGTAGRKYAFRGNRVAGVMTSVQLGDATDNPTYSFEGTGVITSGGVHRGPDGSTTAPAFSFTSDTDCGLYRLGANNIGISVGNAYAGGWVFTGGNPQYQANDGTAALPSVSFQSDPDTGLYWISANALGFAEGGTGFRIGFRQIPRSTTVTTLAIGDVGKCVAVTAAIAVPVSVFAAGDAISIYNDSGTAINVTCTSTTLRLAGSTATPAGTRVLAARGMGTLWFNTGGATPDVICSGNFT